MRNDLELGDHESETLSIHGGDDRKGKLFSCVVFALLVA
jgi:hypothetical protein